MNSRVKYITAAIFIFILELLISNQMWFLSTIFGVVTISYIALEFYGLKPKYFVRISAILTVFTWFLMQFNPTDQVDGINQLMGVAEWSGDNLLYYVLMGLAFLANFI